MARIAGGGAARRNKRAALPSAQELLGAFYGLGSKQTAGISKITGSGASMFAGLPTASSVGEFSEFISLTKANDTMRYYTGTKKVANLAGEALAPNLDSDVYYVDKDGNFVDRSVYRQSYDVDEDTGELIVPGERGPQFGESDAPAPITVVPTSTSDPARPRTVAAGYDNVREVITVVFRDGTFYNYYECSAGDWQKFKSVVSKGQYIYTFLDYKPRGAADVSSLSANARKTFYKFTRAAQLNYGGRPPKKRK
jgi:hypothetical protein